MGAPGAITEDDRTTSLGIIRFSIEYFAAAIAAHEKLERAAPGGVRAVPVHTLTGQSIELALKAFLRQQGATLSALKKLRHNLDAAMDSAESNGLSHSADRQHLSLLKPSPSQRRERVALCAGLD